MESPVPGTEAELSPGSVPPWGAPESAAIPPQGSPAAPGAARGWVPRVPRSVPGASPAHTPFSGGGCVLGGGDTHGAAAALWPWARTLRGPGLLRSGSRPGRPRCGGLGRPPARQAAEGAGGPGIGSKGRAARAAPGWGIPPRARVASSRAAGGAPGPQAVPSAPGVTRPTRLQTRPRCAHPALLPTPPELVPLPGF